MCLYWFWLEKMGDYLAVGEFCLCIDYIIVNMLQVLNVRLVFFAGLWHASWWDIMLLVCCVLAATSLFRCCNMLWYCNAVFPALWLKCFGLDWMVFRMCVVWIFELSFICRLRVQEDCVWICFWTVALACVLLMLLQHYLQLLQCCGHISWISMNQLTMITCCWFEKSHPICLWLHWTRALRSLLTHFYGQNTSWRFPQHTLRFHSAGWLQSLHCNRLIRCCITCNFNLWSCSPASVCRVLM